MILKMLDQREQSRELIHFVENEHHPLEEQELFPYIKNQVFLGRGGPRCSFFMGLRLDFDFAREDRALLEKFYAQTGYRPPAYAIPPWLTDQSPLSIPFNEHVLGAELAGSILYLLNQPESEFYKEFYAALYERYSRLLRLHIDKEDNCLFIMCEQNLP